MFVGCMVVSQCVFYVHMSTVDVSTHTTLVVLVHLHWMPNTSSNYCYYYDSFMPNVDTTTVDNYMHNTYLFTVLKYQLQSY